MRHKLLFLLLVIALMLPVRLSAFEYTYEGVTLDYTVIDKVTKTCKVSGYKDFSGVLVIPDAANDGSTGYIVTSIGDKAFFDCSSLTSVEIPNSVTSIGRYAFKGCSGLTSVVIPNSVTEIGEDAFSSCDGLTKAEFSSIESLCRIVFDDHFSNPLHYANHLYIDGKEVTEVVIPETVTSIGRYAFEGCSGLTSVVIPNSVTEIGEDAFWNCDGLKKSAYPDTLNSPFGFGRSVPYNPKGAIIEDGWIWGPDKSAIYFAPLSYEGEYTIPETVTSIGRYAFSECNGLTSVMIPNSVTSIGSGAFSGCRNLPSIEIPNSVTSIGSGAFSGCIDLTSIEIPNSVTSIGSGAFLDCIGLQSVEIPNSVTSIGRYAFKGCFRLTSVVIGNSVTSIGDGAFFDCSSLPTVVIPNSVTEIGKYAFINCKLDTIIMGNGVQIIGNEAFKNCLSFHIYITAQTPPKIEAGTFDNYSGQLYLQGQAAVDAYGEDEYWGSFNSELMIEPTALEIEGMNSISGYAGDTFQLNAKMTPADVTLPYIFWRSTNPKIATVDHNGLVTLQEYTADDLIQAEGNEGNDGTCRIIAETLYFNGPIAEISVNNRPSAFEYTYAGVTLKYSIIDKEAKICKVSGYKDFSGELVIPDVANDGYINYSVTEIGMGAFSFCSGLTSVVIPNSVTSIGEFAFYRCSSLNSVVIGNSVTSIGKQAFTLCSGLIKAEFSSIESLCRIVFDDHFSNPLRCANHLYIDGKEVTEVVIPETVTSIGRYAFSSYRDLTSVVIPNSVTSIGDYAFDDCSGLKSVVIGNSVTSIGESAFSYCSGLTSVEIPNSVTKIGSSAFSRCNGLTSVVIGNSVTKIGESAFEYCSSLIKAEYSCIESLCSISFDNHYSNPLSYAHCLYIDGVEVTEVIIPETVTSIGRYTFYGCSGLTSVVIPNSVTSISEGTFRECSGLTSVVIPNSILSIARYAFYGCSSLTSVVIPNSVTVIGEAAFCNCQALTSVVIGNSVTAIVASAFAYCYSLKSVVIPNSVTEIGWFAFYGCNLDTIIMGYGVDTIGRQTFKTSRASRIYITAQIPPKIESETFGYPRDLLYLQGQSAVNAYGEDEYWRSFNSELMTEPTVIVIEDINSISGNAYDTFQLNAKMTPADVTLPYIFWRSTNTKIATVDHNGLVTLQEYTADDMIQTEGAEDNYGTCSIIAESLYFNGPIAEIKVYNTSINGVESVRNYGVDIIDYGQPYDVYNMNGQKVADSTEGLSNGIYIIRQGKATMKTVVR